MALLLLLKQGEDLAICPCEAGGVYHFQNLVDASPDAPSFQMLSATMTFDQMLRMCRRFSTHVKHAKSNGKDELAQYIVKIWETLKTRMNSLGVRGVATVGKTKLVVFEFENTYVPFTFTSGEVFDIERIRSLRPTPLTLPMLETLTTLEVKNLIEQMGMSDKMPKNKKTELYQRAIEDFEALQPVLLGDHPLSEEEEALSDGDDEVLPDTVAQDDITVKVMFKDMRKTSQPELGGFQVVISPDLSVVTLAIQIIDDVIKSDALVEDENFRNLAEFNFKQVLFFKGDPLLPNFMSIKSFNICNNDVVEMRIYEVGDKRFEKLMAPPKFLLIKVEMETDSLKLRFTFDDQTSGEDMFHFIEASTGLEKDNYQLKWAGTGSKVEPFDRVAGYFSSGDRLDLVPTLSGGGKMNVQKILKDKVKQPKNINVDDVFNTVMKVKSWQSVNFEVFMKSMTYQEVKQMEDVFNTGRAHLETRIKKMAEITKEVIQFNEAMAQIDIASRFGVQGLRGELRR